MKFNFYALKLSGIMMLFFALQAFIPGFTEIFLLRGDSPAEIWRFVSSIFLHGSITHLLYNLFALAFFGSIVERLVGGRKFLVVFFVTGLLANVVSVNFYEASLGASGAIFGIIGALVLIRPGQMVWAFGMPMPMFIAGIAWATGDIIGLFSPGNVANIAHLSGMFFGLIFGMFFRVKKQRRGKIKIDEKSMQNWEKIHLE